MNLNPYAAPLDGLPPERSTSVSRETALYTPGQVALATFFGSPLAGAVVMAINERRLGRRGAAALVVYGALATAALLALSFVIPLPLGLAALFVMRALARKQQGAAVSQHLAGGGRKASGWAAFGIGLLSLAAVAVPLVLVMLALDVS